MVDLENKMDDGFQRLKTSIDIAAKDAAKTERLLREHVQQPMH